MSIRRVYTLGDPILRKKAKKVKQFNKDLKTLVDDMVETMHASVGMGLAAPQVGISEQVIVVQVPDEYEEEQDAGKLFALVNPEIISASEEQEAGDEGCLSIPGIVGEVTRSCKIKLKAQSLKGMPVRITAEGYLARAFQHEIDHLDGVLFIDRIETPETLRRITPEGETEPIEIPA